MLQLGYFDNAATTLKKVPGLYEYIAQYMNDYGLNSGRGEYGAVRSTGKMVNDTRHLLLNLVHADTKKEVIFCPSATIAINTIIRGIDISAGDNVYISHFEHNAVVRVLHNIQKEVKFNLEYITLDSSSLEYNEHAIKAQFAAKKPKAIIVSQVSNVCGLVQPIEMLFKIAKEYKAITIADAAQACGVIDTTLENIDYYVFAGHKTLYAPFGVAGFICNKTSTLKAFIYGGTGIDSANLEMPDTIPERFEAGSLNTMAIAGLNYSLKWILEKGIQCIRGKEIENYNRLKEILSTYDFISLVGICESTSAIISCKFKGYAPDEIGGVLDRLGISVRTGLHCAPIAHKFLNTFPEGTVRFSISYFTELNDFDRLKEALDTIEEQM